MYTKRPRIKIEKRRTDVFLELFTFLFIALSVALIAIYYNQLPDQIPIHFNWPSKDANGFGSKSLLWMSPIICGILAIGIYFLSGFPRVFNYPVKITAENAEYQYKQAIQMIRLMNLVIALLCFFLTAVSIADGLGTPTNFARYIHIIFPILFIGIPLFFIYKMFSFRTDVHQKT